VNINHLNGNGLKSQAKTAAVRLIAKISDAELSLHRVSEDF